MFQGNHLNRITRGAVMLSMALAALWIMVVPAAAQTTSNGVYIELAGTIESVTPNSIQVGVFNVDITRADIDVLLAAGVLVEVEGWLQADGSIAARDVDPYDRDDDLLPGEAEIIGTLESFSDNTIVVDGLSIDVSNAVFEDRVVVGDRVEVYAPATSPTVWSARRVELANDDSSGSDDNSRDDSSRDDSRRDDDRNAQTAVSAEEAISIVLSIFPNTRITEVDLDRYFGTLVWEIYTSHGIEVYIDAETGVVLRIEREDDDDDDRGRDDDDRGRDDDDDSSRDDDDRDDDDDDDDWDDDDDDDWDDDDDDEWDDDDDDDDDD